MSIHDSRLLGRKGQQTVAEFPLWPIDPNLSEDQWPSERVTYRSCMLDDRGLNRGIREVSFATLTIFRPAPENDKGIAMVACPGGGYGIIVIDREGNSLARHFQNLGYTVAVLKYRLPSPQVTGAGLPLSQQDALEAIRQIRARSVEWGLKHVGIIGASAGGHLACSTAFFGVAAEGTCPDFVAALYPVVSMEDPLAHKDSRRALLGQAPRPELMAAYSLEKLVRSGLPPFFLIHAVDDSIVSVENSRVFAAALRKVNCSVKLTEYQTGGHAFSLGVEGHATTRWKMDFVEWLEAVLASRGGEEAEKATSAS